MAANGTSDHTKPDGNASHSANERVSAGHSAANSPLHRLAELIAASPHNLVSRSERPAVFDRHVVECDRLAALLAPAGRWMDLGTGGGLPGLVLAYRFPSVAWVLVDATAKKVASVVGFAHELQLDNVTAVQGRAETLAHQPLHRGQYDGVVTRAVAPLDVLTELCRGFLADGGLLVAVKGPAWPAELDAARGACQRLGYEVLPTRRIEGAARPSWVVTMRALGHPPAQFPRRDGLPKADPLR